jgi:hypothetical protein
LNCAGRLQSIRTKTYPGSQKSVIVGQKSDVTEIDSDPRNAATRKLLIGRGARMGNISSKNGLDLCNGKDPDGNPFGLSNRGQ